MTQYIIDKVKNFKPCPFICIMLTPQAWHRKFLRLPWITQSIYRHLSIDMISPDCRVQCVIKRYSSEIWYNGYAYYVHNSYAYLRQREFQLQGSNRYFHWFCLLTEYFLKINLKTRDRMHCTSWCVHVLWNCTLDSVIENSCQSRKLSIFSIF